MELRHLRYFAAVADCENVSRAAERLHVSQPPLSRAIKELETELGVALFERVRKRLRLTSAGRSLLDSVRGVLTQTQQLRRHADALADGRMGRLQIGYVDGAMENGILGKCLNRFRVDQPDVRLELRPMLSGAQIAALRTGELDLAFMYTPTLEGNDIAATKVLVEPQVLAMRADDPLARSRRLTSSQLHNSPWIALSPTEEEIWVDRLLTSCIAAGFRPDIRARAMMQSTVLGLVEAGIGRAFVMASAARNPRRDVRFRSLAWWPHKVEIWVGWRRSRLLPGVARFLKLNALV